MSIAIDRPIDYINIWTSGNYERETIQHPIYFGVQRTHSPSLSRALARRAGTITSPAMASHHQPWQSFHTVYTNAKAGMDGVDKEKVQRVVYEMSKGSRYFENEHRKEAALQQRVQHMRNQAALVSAADLMNHEKVADRRLAELEATRNLSRTWMHVDLDAFYAAVETLEDPSLAGKPMAVGGMSMICTANYEARRFGVRAAMPGFIARRLCPDLIFVSPNFEKYTRYSEEVRKVFRDYDPHFLARSLDEAYLDITEQCSLRSMSSGEVAEELRRLVHEKTGLTCSAGVGPNRLIAKVCSDINKPNGQFVLPSKQEPVMEFFSTLPIRKISGIGKVTEQLLKEVLGISICGELIEKRALISALFSRTTTEFFLSVGLGIGGSDVPQEEPRKSLSSERTFSTISSESELFKKLGELAAGLSKDMEEEGLHGRTLTLKLKTTDFEVQTRSLSLPHFVHSKEDLMFHASKLLKAELPVSLRLMGLRISHFQTQLLDSSQRTLADFIHANSPELGKISESVSVQSHSADSEWHSNGNAQFKQPQNQIQHEFPPPCSMAVTFETDETQEFQSSSSEGLVYQEGCTSAVDAQKNQFCRNGNFGPSLSETFGQGQIELLFKNVSSVKKRNGNSVHTRGIQPPALALEKRLDILVHRGDKYSQKVDQFSLDSPTIRQSVAMPAMDLECRFSDVMMWVEDTYCSLCGLEIPASFLYERQEHADFHLAQMLQQEYLHTDFIYGKAEGLKEQGKRHCRSSGKVASSKKALVNKVDCSKDNKKHIPIDSFFLKS